MNKNSLAAYEEIKSSGLLSRARMEVYGLVVNYSSTAKPLTAGELFKIGRDLNQGHIVVKGAVCGRLKELEDLGVVIRMANKVCSVTNKVADTWVASGELPDDDALKEAKRKRSSIDFQSVIQVSIRKLELSPENIPEVLQLLKGAING